MSNIESSWTWTCGPEAELRKFINRTRAGDGHGFGRMDLRGHGVPVDETGAPLGVFDVECPDEAARPLAITFESRRTESDRVVLAISAAFPELLFGHLFLDECRGWVGWQVVRAGETLAEHVINNLFDGGGLWEPVATDPFGHFHPSLGVHNGYEAISGDDWQCAPDIDLLLQAVPRQLALDHGLGDALSSIEDMARSGEMPETISEHVTILRAHVECRRQFLLIANDLGLKVSGKSRGTLESFTRLLDACGQTSTVQRLLEAMAILRRLTQERREPPGSTNGS